MAITSKLINYKCHQPQEQQRLRRRKMRATEKTFAYICNMDGMRAKDQYRRRTRSMAKFVITRILNATGMWPIQTTIPTPTIECIFSGDWKGSVGGTHMPCQHWLNELGSNESFLFRFYFLSFYRAATSPTNLTNNNIALRQENAQLTRKDEEKEYQDKNKKHWLPAQQLSKNNLLS